MYERARRGACGVREGACRVREARTGRGGWAKEGARGYEGARRGTGLEEEACRSFCEVQEGTRGPAWCLWGTERHERVRLGRLWGTGAGRVVLARARRFRGRAASFSREVIIVVWGEGLGLRHPSGGMGLREGRLFRGKLMAPW